MAQAIKTSGAHVDCAACQAYAKPGALRDRWWENLSPGAPVNSLVHAVALHLQAVDAANRSPKTLTMYDGRYR
jgi:hypothetical protein